LKKGWELQDYVNFVKLQLGGSLLQLAIEKEIPFIIEKMALVELMNYMKMSFTMTLPFAPMYDLSDKKVENVKYVLRGQNANNMATGINGTMISRSNGNIGLNQVVSDFMVSSLLVSQIQNTISTDMDFQFDKPNQTLYLFAQPPLPFSITIGYTPVIEDVNEIYSPHWINYLRRLSVAYAKEQEGRIRSKYTLNSATYTLDGATLLSEGQSELAQIRTELNSNVNASHTIS